MTYQADTEKKTWWDYHRQTGR